MTDEQTTTPDTEGDKVDTPKKEDETLNIVEEAKKVRDEIKSENDRRERILEDEKNLRAKQLLIGTSGGNQEVIPKDRDQILADKLLADSE